MLIGQARKTDEVTEKAMGMETILTNPDHLADYTDRFFTDVIPVDIGEPVATQAPQQYQQQFDMPAPPASTAGSQQGITPQNQWEAFSQVSNKSPENAWRYLQNMGPEALRSKLLFLEPS